ncbi:MAG: hypothetical protein EHM23_24980 [Acidobacteria bacterium]|nr:MAG: hypothetical protein EHM23_24980 [Acidobacteriota bacterium]
MPPDTRLRRKLGLKQGQRLAMVNMPYWFLECVGLINNTVLGDENLRNPDYVQIFARSAEQLEASLHAALRNFRPGAILWICHPDSPGGLDLDCGSATRLLADCGFEKIKELPLPNRWLASRFREAGKGNSTVN